MKKLNIKETTTTTTMNKKLNGINPKVLKWAREQAGFSLEDAAHAIGLCDSSHAKGFEKLSALEAGEKLPTRRQLQNIASTYKRATFTFYLSHPPRKPDILKNKKPYGIGIITYPNGDKYDGWLKNGRPHGIGIMTYANGREYRGCWKNGLRHGYGVLIYNNIYYGIKYEGFWKKDCKHGFGIETNADGAKIFSKWKNDIKKCHEIVSDKDGNQHMRQ